MRILLKNRCLLITLLTCSAQAGILDRIEYKLGRVNAQTINLANEVNELENIINGEPHVPFTNNDGNLYPVELAIPPIHLDRVSELSRLARSQAALRIPNIEDFGGIWWRNCEGECWLAVDPADQRHMVAVITQDRSNMQFNLGINIRVSHDAGLSWSQAHTVLSRCQGSSPGHSNADFQRASRPSVIFNNDGSTVYIVYVASNARLDRPSGDNPKQDEAIVCIKSTNGGQSWYEPQIIFGDDGTEHWLEAPTIWANPYEDNTVYAVWTDMQFFVGNGAHSFIKVSRSLDAGTTWEPPVNAITIDSSINNFAPFEAQILVDPSISHTLYLLAKNSQIFTPYPSQAEGITAHSTDGGATWTTVSVVSGLAVNVAQDPDEPGTYIRTAPTMFDATINNINGKLYVVTQNGQFAPPGMGGVTIFMSVDGGVTWSSPIPVNSGSLSAQAFNPSIRVAADGHVGVLYYDFRNHTVGSPALETDVWLAVFDEDLTTLVDEFRLTPVSFDIRQAMRANLELIGIPGGARHFFPGDYCKLQFAVTDFVAAFQITNPPYGIGPSPIPSSQYEVDLRNRQDIIFGRVPH